MEIKELRNIVGWRAFNALVKGRPLIVWRCTNPHNWWIPASKSSDCQFLWHSEKGSNKPDLKMFEHRESCEKVINHFGYDSGMPIQSLYFLKEEYKGK